MSSVTCVTEQMNRQTNRQTDRQIDKQQTNKKQMALSDLTSTSM
jgi:hypothetical protein